MSLMNLFSNKEFIMIGYSSYPTYANLLFPKKLLGPIIFVNHVAYRNKEKATVKDVFYHFNRNHRD